MDFFATDRLCRIACRIALGLAVSVSLLAMPWGPRAGAKDAPAENKAPEPAAPAAPDAGAAAAADPVGPPPSLFKHIIKSAGIVFGPLLLVISIILVAL